MRDVYVLSLAGLDPSGGAGLAADLKTFEALGVSGLGTCTAITFQNHREFRGVQWSTLDTIKNQLEPLLSQYNVKAVKFGLIQSLKTLENLISHISAALPGVPMIWDPILSASAGYTFHESAEMKKLEHICGAMRIITPNHSELGSLDPAAAPEDTAQRLSSRCAVLVTGINEGPEIIRDCLYEGGLTRTYRNSRIHGGEKHGSGCVLSAALSAYIAMGRGTESACGGAMRYTRNFLSSSTSLVGRHYRESLEKN